MATKTNMADLTSKDLHTEEAGFRQREMKVLKVKRCLSAALCSEL